MIREMGTWIVLCVKRQMQKKVFLLALLLLPLLSWFLVQFEQEDDGKLYVAVYAQDEQGEYEERLFEALRNQERITFYRCDSLEMLEKDVNAMKAECGLVFGEKMRERIQQENYTDLITIYASPATTNVALTKEIVYAQFAKTFGSHWTAERLLETIGDAGYDDAGYDDAGYDKDRVQEELEELFRVCEAENTPFHFQYETVHGSVIEQKKAKTPVFPLKGMIGVHMMLIAMFGVTDMAKDRKLMVYRAFGRGSGYLAGFFQVAMPTMITGAFALVSLLLTGYATDILHEAAALLVYSLLLSLVMNIFYQVLKNERIFCGAIPVSVIGSLVFCPVFIDVQVLFPQIGAVSYLFLPYYYLML